VGWRLYGVHVSHANPNSVQAARNRRLQ
jgi:hypothetical protein